MKSILQEEEINMGTTILALRYKEGVVVGADTRTSVSSYVSNRYSNKIEYLFREQQQQQQQQQHTQEKEGHRYNNNYVVLCRSGSAADTQYLTDEVRWEFESRSLRYGMTTPSVEQVAHYIRFLMVQQTGGAAGSSFSASLICAGYNVHEGRGRIYSITTSGAIFEEDMYALGGSGSTFVLGYMDNRFNNDNINNNNNSNNKGWTEGQQQQQLLDEKDAINVVTEALQLAMNRDGSSGGVARIVVINKNGSRECIVYPSHASTTSTSLLDSSKNPKPKILPGFATPPPSVRSLNSPKDGSF